MTAIEYYPIKSRDEWLKWRDQDITASDIAAVCGLNPHRSVLQVYAEKMGIVTVTESELMRRGRWFQPAILAALRERRPDLYIWEPNCYYRDPETFIGATPDFFACPAETAPMIVEGIDLPAMVIEGKIVSSPVFRSEWLGLDDGDGADANASLADGDIVVPPIHFEMQAYVQAVLTQAPQAMVAALSHSTWDSELYEAPLDMAAMARSQIWDFVIERVDRFRFCLKKETPPTETLLPKIDSPLLNKIYPRDDGPALDLSRDKGVGILLVRLDQLEAERKLWKKSIDGQSREIDEIKTELKAMMGMSQLGEYPGWTITCKAVHVAPNNGYSYRKLHIKRSRE